MKRGVSNPNILTSSKRRASIAAAAATALLASSACSLSPNEASVPITAEANEIGTPRQRMDAIAKDLSDGKLVQNVKVAYDYNLVYTDDGKLHHPDGISNPFVLEDNTYGYVVYNATGNATGLVAPSDGKLVEALPASAYNPERENPTNPHITDLDISPVYYESSAYGESGRYYVTATGEQPGLVPQTTDVVRVADVFTIGK